MRRKRRGEGEERVEKEKEEEREEERKEGSRSGLWGKRRRKQQGETKRRADGGERKGGALNRGCALLECAGRDEVRCGMRSDVVMV